jgi:hypothetical protein
MTQEQPPNKDTEDQNLNITGTTQGTQTTEQTQQTQQTNITQEFLALLDIQGGSDNANAGGFGEVQTRAEARVSTSEPGVVGVRFEARGARTSQPQQATTEATASLTREVDCRPCGGCCGGRRGRRLPGRVYDFVAWVAGVRGVPMCQVVNEFPELFCVGGGGRGGGGVGVSERGLRVRFQYMAGYFL